MNLCSPFLQLAPKGLYFQNQALFYFIPAECRTWIRIRIVPFRGHVLNPRAGGRATSAARPRCCGHLRSGGRKELRSAKVAPAAAPAASGAAFAKLQFQWASCHCQMSALKAHCDKRKSSESSGGKAVFPFWKVGVCYKTHFFFVK